MYVAMNRLNKVIPTGLLWICRHTCIGLVTKLLQRCMHWFSHQASAETHASVESPRFCRQRALQQPFMVLLTHISIHGCVIQDCRCLAAVSWVVVLICKDNDHYSWLRGDSCDSPCSKRPSVLAALWAPLLLHQAACHLDHGLPWSSSSSWHLQHDHRFEATYWPFMWCM